MVTTMVPIIAAIAMGACTRRAAGPGDAASTTPPALATKPSPSPRAPIRATVRGACRSPNVIGPVGTTSRSPRGLTELAGVAASASGCTLAVWNHSGAYVSRDDGTSWVHVLAVTTRAHDVAIGAAEQVFILAQDELAVARGDGTSAYRQLPFTMPTWVATSGDWVIVAIQRELALSHDEGATWTRHALPRALTGPTAFHIDQAGTISLAIGASRDEPLALFRSSPAGWHEAWTSPHPPQQQPPHIDAFAFARDGALIVADMNRPALVLVASDDRVTTTPGLPATIDLAGISIAGAALTNMQQVAAYDAHGNVLMVFYGRGPIRFINPEISAFTIINPYNERGHWLVGDLMPAE
jgi:hypothetical protein